MSSATDEWATPQSLFNTLNGIYGPLDLDVCATTENAKCQRFYERADNGLLQPWEGRCWMNPPYGRKIGKWVQRAHDAAMSGEAEIVVCLLPSRTDTAWWHDYCMKGEVTFLRGRVRFEHEGKNNCAPFPSAVVVFCRGQRVMNENGILLVEVPS